jgi:hypothetical protein
MQLLNLVQCILVLASCFPGIFKDAQLRSMRD